MTVAALATPKPRGTRVVAGRIPQEFIDDLVARADIVDVIEERVPLRRAGREFKACCPFHEEKTPSFTVSREKQFYHCFGCGAHGTVLGFLMDYAHMDFVEAVETLAERLGMTVPHEEGPAREAGTQAIYELLESAADWYRQQLRTHPAAERAVEYLRGRGLDGRTAAEFGLGFAPPGWDNLVRALGPGAAERRALVRAGLAAERGRDDCHDRLRNRVVFPIRDRRGRTVGFGGRVLDAADSPKYLNSPETPVFHKGRELYGLYEARKVLRKIERIVVVEGYMDVLALAQHGIRWVVATLGTAATHEHVERLFRTTPDVVFCFDGDEAGRRAAWRALENALPAMRDGRQALFVFLPEGEDPDTLVRGRGPDGFEPLVAAALPLSDFLVRELRAHGDPATVEGRARFVEAARPLVERVPPGTYRRLLGGRIAEVAGLAPAEWSTLSGTARETPKTQRPAAPAQAAPSRLAYVIKRLLHHPSLALEVESTNRLQLLELAGIEVLVELLELARARPDVTTAGLLERFRGHRYEGRLQNLAASEVVELSDGLRQEFRDAIAWLEHESDERRYQELVEKSQLGPLTPEELAEFARLAQGRAGPRGASAAKPFNPG